MSPSQLRINLCVPMTHAVFAINLCQTVHDYCAVLKIFWFPKASKSRLSMASKSITPNVLFVSLVVRRLEPTTGHGKVCMSLPKLRKQCLAEKPYCLVHYCQIRQLQCARCNSLIQDGTAILAIDRVFHLERCFRCSCGKQFSANSEFYTSVGPIWCDAMSN